MCEKTKQTRLRGITKNGLNSRGDNLQRQIKEQIADLFFISFHGYVYLSILLNNLLAVKCRVNTN